MPTTNSRRRWLWPALILALALDLGIWRQALAPDSHRGLSVTFLDVGQGDSAIIRTPSGKTVLVDAGGRPGSGEDEIGYRVVLPALRRYGVNKVDLAIATHAHDDHIGGMAAVVEGIPVSMELESGPDPDSSADMRLRKALAARRIPCRSVHRGDVIDFHDGARIDVLNPPTDATGEESTAANDGSIVLRVSYNGHSVMLTGDAGAETEQEILASGAEVRSDVLKVGHHGSAIATSEAWIEAVAPRVAVISVGRNNSFGHPSEEVLDRLSERHIAIHRTDREGAVSIEILDEQATSSASPPIQCDKPARQ